MSDALPMLVVGHGTRSDAGVSEFGRLIDRVRRRCVADGVAVAGGFIELSPPPVTEAVAGLVSQGHRELVAVPLVLVAAGHGKGDIPGALAREQDRYPGLRYRYGRPLGPHPTLLTLLADRVDAALAGADGADRARTTVVLVGRGSTDPDGNAEVAKVARLLWEGSGYAGVETSFVSLAWPGVPDALERARRLGGRRIVVAPYFLFPGVLPDRIVEQTAGFAAAHPELDVRTAGLLGDCDGLADLVAERYREAIAGDIRMNCDTCAYRIPLPGFEGKVGQAQTPHHHPADPAAPAQHGHDAHDGDHSHGGHSHGGHGHGHSDDGHDGGHGHGWLEAGAVNSRDDDHAGVDLAHHGDADAAAGLVDLAVNVRLTRPPAWLADRIGASLAGIARYPRDEAARAAVAARHARTPAEVLLTAGAAEAFVLLARALRPRRAVVVHPQFTGPEAALRAAGHPVRRILLTERDGFRLDPAAVPEDADLVVLGNPTNPTSVLHPAQVLARLARPGRVLVVDEAFMDAVPGEPETVAAAADLPGLVVVRSLTKTWGLAGLRVGYLLGAADLVTRLAAAQPPWPVSTPALAALEAGSAPAAVAEGRAAADVAESHRTYLVAALGAVPAVRVAGSPQAPFVLLQVAGGATVRAGLRRLGYAVRRGETFPGLGPDWLRVAVRDPAVTDTFVAALAAVLGGRDPEPTDARNGGVGSDR